ncbi:hypothetical protein GCM10027605_67850 [Micromonospora zhanjiangensis]
MLSEEKPMLVPVSVDGWRWPIRSDRIECGECGDRLEAERLTAISELAEVLAAHTSRCRVFS